MVVRCIIPCCSRKNQNEERREREGGRRGGERRDGENGVALDDPTWV